MITTEPFELYKSDLADKRVILLSQSILNGFKCIKPADGSRYFPQGRKRIKARIRKRLGAWFGCPGIILTLTFDPKLIEREDAWAYVGKLRRKFIDRINRKRVAQGKAKLKFLSVIEEQKKSTHYPHLHIVFPYLKWLEAKDYLTKAWGWGHIDVKYYDNLAPVNYLCKYITKMEGWSLEANNYIWLFGTRLYSISRDYSLPNYADKKAPEWKFYMAGDSRTIALWYLSRNHLLQRVREGPVPYPLTYLDQSSYDALIREAEIN